MRHILILDTDVERCDRLAFLLRHSGYAVEVHPGGTIENPATWAQEPDLVVVSEQLMGLGVKGEASWVVKRFTAPKIVLGSEAEEVAGIPYLELGADAYLPAPLNMRLMLARARALLNRPQRRKNRVARPKAAARSRGRHDV